MEYLGSMWSYQESMDEVKQSLLYKTLELESVKAEADEKLSKYKEEMSQLIDLLKLAYQERDEAKDQLQKLLNKVMPSETNPIPHQQQPDSPIVIQGKANSSITESNSLSETYNPQYSHSSSPVDSFFHDAAAAAAVSSPEFSSINIAAAPPVMAAAKVDPLDAVIDHLVKGKALPQQGSLLQTVMEAGPLLNTLLVAGPLPRWRNPPKLQTFKIPPVSIKGCDGSGKTSAAAQLQQQKAFFGSQTCSAASMLNFGNGAASGSGFGSGWSLGSGGVSQFPAGKRQRFQ
ncbi:unnamed protein product [Linum tenue]|uniref:Uncharacterized protein n=1 Tax=Linum tenue TaxID=586396 RepID=A0AAV0PVC6_9ROSI|nr:unnamed protein product [Linum tenue]